jgi:hypothetical protein
MLRSDAELNAYSAIFVPWIGNLAEIESKENLK